MKEVGVEPKDWCKCWSELSFWQSFVTRSADLNRIQASLLRGKSSAFRPQPIFGLFRLHFCFDHR